MNKCIFIGNLTRDPEIATTANGVNRCTFAIAVNRRYTNSNGEREADFINVIAWRGLGDNCGKYLKKGSKIAVVGEMQNRSYDDKDGNRRYTTEIVAEDVEFLSSASSSNGADNPTAAENGGDKASEKSASDKKKRGKADAAAENEDLPF